MNRNKFFQMITPVLAATFLVACGGGDTSPPATVKPAKIPVQEVVTEVSAEAALLKRGKIVWFKCRSCHETSVTGPHKVGPNLNGLMGAKAGQKEGFTFSSAMKESGVVWDDAALSAFIEKPSAYIKGTKMAFVGIRKESDRQAVIAYIKENTK